MSTVSGVSMGGAEFCAQFVLGSSCWALARNTHHSHNTVLLNNNSPPVFSFSQLSLASYTLIRYQARENHVRVVLKKGYIIKDKDNKDCKINRCTGKVI